MAAALTIILMIFIAGLMVYYLRSINRASPGGTRVTATSPSRLRSAVTNPGANRGCCPW